MKTKNKITKLYVKIYLKGIRKPLKMILDNELLLDKFYALLIGPNDIVRFYDLIVNRTKIIYISIEEKFFKKV